jgi:xanthine dehydrogenase accessory factor
MNEARTLLRAAAELRAAGTPFVVATVVSVRGSSYRRPGARLIATAEGRVAGSVSGGCLEKDLVRTSWWRTQSGAVVVRYDSSDSDSPQAALGCGGEVDVLLERANTGERGDDPMSLVERAMASERVAALATVYRGSGEVAVGTRWCLSAGELVSSGLGPRSCRPTRPSASALQRIARACEEAIASRRVVSLRHHPSSGAPFEALIEPLVPPPHLFVFGTGVDALPVVEAAGRLGWSVTLWEPSAHFESRARFATTGAMVMSGDLDRVRARIDGCDRALAIVMSHNLAHDQAALAMLLGSRAGYIGVLGPRHRTTRLASPAALADSRVHAPVGLDLGAETPEEIALSVTAEMLASVRHRTGELLRTCHAIHDHPNADETSA